MNRATKLQATKLTRMERSILRGHASGIPALDAVRNAGSTISTERNARARINAILRNKPEARGYLAGLMAKAEAHEINKALLTREEKRAFCARTLRANITTLDFDKDGDLLNEHRVTTTEFAETVHVKLMGKKDAIVVDNELAGHKTPDEHTITADDTLGQILADLATSAQQRHEADKF